MIVIKSINFNVCPIIVERIGCCCCCIICSLEFNYTAHEFEHWTTNCWRDSIHSHWFYLWMLFFHLIFRCSYMLQSIVNGICSASHSLVPFRDFIYSVLMSLVIAVLLQSLIWTVRCIYFFFVRTCLGLTAAYINSWTNGVSVWYCVCERSDLVTLVEKLHWHSTTQRMYTMASFILYYYYYVMPRDRADTQLR